MSTVIITPTHIASDHTVIRTIFPHHADIDLGYKKIFIPPNKKLVIGVVGEFVPSDIDRPAVYDALEEIFQELVFQQNAVFLSDTAAMITSEKPLKVIKDIFSSPSGSVKMFLLTKNHRYLIFRSKKHKVWVSRVCGPYAGIGSGGMIASGMLIGGVPLNQVFGKLHQLDTLSSAEYTAIPLSSLKKMLRPK